MKLEDRLRPYAGEMEAEWDTIKHGTSLSLTNKTEALTFQFRHGPIATGNKLEIVFKHAFRDMEQVLTQDYPLQSIRKEVTEWLKDTSSYRLLLLLQDIPLVWSIYANIPYREETHNLSINVLQITVRTHNVLKRDGYGKIGDLQRINKDYIENATSLGANGKFEIQQLMKEWRFSLCP